MVRLPAAERAMSAQCILLGGVWEGFWLDLPDWLIPSGPAYAEIAAHPNMVRHLHGRWATLTR